MTLQKWEVGPEYDERVFRRLGKALTAAGFGFTSDWNALCGSQEVSHWKISAGSGELVIEAETYVGLTVTGPPGLVDRLRSEYEAINTL